MALGKVAAFALLAVAPFATAGIQPCGDPILPGTGTGAFDPGYPAASSLQPICTPSPAEFTRTGEDSGPSWGQRFAFDCMGNGSADLVAVYAQTGGRFVTPTLRDFDSAGWYIQLDSSSQAAAGAPAEPADRLSFEVWFVGRPTSPVSIVFGAWHPGEQGSFEACHLTWARVGGAFEWVTAPCEPGFIPRPVDAPDPPAVPVPAAGVLGALGLGVLSGCRTMRKRFS